MTDTDIRLVEDSVRTLAAAAGSARLYPAGSPMTGAAIDRFVEAARRATTALGDFRLVVDPKDLRYAASSVADGSTAIEGLAETLYSQRAGQLLVSRGVTPEETAAFLAAIDDDPVTVRDAGGVRAVVAAAGVTHLALAEIELRDEADVSSDDSLDPMTASLPEIAVAVAESAVAWAEAAAAGPASDGPAGLLAAVGPTDHPLAQERVAKALLSLDERSRLAVLEAALTSDTTGRPMEGTLSIVEKLPPAALARLLALFADGSGGRLAGALSAIRIPPEAAWALEALLASNADEVGTDPVAIGEDLDVMAAAMAMEEPVDAMARWRLVESATAKDSASRALDTTLVVLSSRPVAETVAAVGVALQEAARESAWRTAARAATALDLVGRRHAGLTAEVETALAPLEDVDTMKLACRAVATDGASGGDSGARSGTSPPSGAAEVLALGGRAAAEALTATYVATSLVAERRRLAAVAVRLSNPLAGYAARTIRGAESADAIATIELLATAPSRGTAGAIGCALDHLDPAVRAGALRALCDSDEPEARRWAILAIDHWDPATRRVAAMELGHHQTEEAVDALVRVLWKRKLFERDYELRKQCIESLVEIGSPRGLRGLRRMAAWRFLVGRRGRELRSLAGQAVADLEASPPARYEGKVRP